MNVGAVVEVLKATYEAGKGVYEFAKDVRAMRRRKKKRAQTILLERRAAKIVSSAKKELSRAKVPL